MILILKYLREARSPIMLASAIIPLAIIPTFHTNFKKPTRPKKNITQIQNICFALILQKTPHRSSYLDPLLAIINLPLGISNNDKRRTQS